MPHVREEEMRAYRNGTLNLADVEAVEAHLRTCPDCRHLFLSEEQVPGAAQALREALRPEGEAPEHLDYGRMRAYIRGEGDSIDRLLVDDHLSECPSCRESLADLEQFMAATQDRPPRVYAPGQFARPRPARAARAARHSPAWRLAAPLTGAAALAVLAAVLPFQKPATRPAMLARGPASPSAAPVPTRPARPHPAPPIATHHFVPAERPLPQEPHHTAAPQPAHRRGETVPGPAPARNARPVAPQAIEKPAHHPVLVAQLPKESSDLPIWAQHDMEHTHSTPPITRSDAEPAAPPIRLVSPDSGNASLLNVRPAFWWQAVPNAASYAVTLETVPEDIDETPRQVEMVTVERPSFQPSRPLDRGRRYRLTVKAQVPPAGTEAIDTGRVEAAWLFRVLSPEEAKQAAWAKANASRRPVPAAMVLYRLDRLADAAKVAESWPDDGRLKGWRAALSRAADERRADPSQ